jgi:hypothetical protein
MRDNPLEDGGMRDNPEEEGGMRDNPEEEGGMRDNPEEEGGNGREIDGDTSINPYIYMLGASPFSANIIWSFISSLNNSNILCLVFSL